MSQPSPPKDLDRPALPYIIPMAGFLLLTQAEAYLPGTADGKASSWYPLAYAAKVAIVAALAWACRSSWRDLRPWPGPAWLALSAAPGLAIAALWGGPRGLYPTFGFLGTRTGFDPNVLSPASKWGFVAVRLLGLVVLVPLIEELFWRSFLMRWIIDPDFVRVPVGRVTPLAATI